MAVRSFQVVLEWDTEDQIWVTYVPTLDFLSTYGETKQEAIANTREAILGFVDAAQKEALPVPSDNAQAELVCIQVQVA